MIDPAVLVAAAIAGSAAGTVLLIVVGLLEQLSTVHPEEVAADGH